MTAVFVFAHPGHELPILGHIQRMCSHILYVTNSDAGDETQRELLAKNLLSDSGIEHTPSFLGLSEKVSFENVVCGQLQPYRTLADTVADWIDARNPSVVFCDAFEWYNFHHDMVSLMVAYANRRRVLRGREPFEHKEVPLAVLSEPTLALASAEAACSLVPHAKAIRLTDDEVAKKKQTLGLYGSASKYFRPIIRLLPEDRISHEIVTERRQPHDYLQKQPVAWTDYDAWGTRRVLQGRYQTPISFQEHFVPIVRALGMAETAQRSRAA